ncbi:hypothetical protein [Flavobacterium sp. 3HN19-14]|uniref:hypothetical protein n=1 Tax=Flavobacterium sp. 3HN19-14 TaxID=3448133 RepID=UPI003EE0D285
MLLQAPYYSLEQLAGNRVPVAPNFLLRYKFATNEAITKIKAPVYVFHGTEDKVIPYENSVQLQKLLKPSDQFTTLKGEDHIGINENPDFQAMLKQILQ